MSKPPKILVVDDDPDMVEVLRVILSSASYEVHSAASAEEGLAKLEEIKPDLLVLDVMLEDRSAGFRLAQTVRRDPEKRKLPIIMLTAIEDETGLKFSPETDGDYVPVDSYMTKPPEPARLLQEAERLLAGHGGPPS